MRSRHLMWALPLVATTSCLDGSAPAPACSDDVQISVGTGLTPQISWRPACLAAAVEVEALDGSGFTWIVNMRDLRRGILPPVVYGTMPPEAEGSDPRPLVTGGSYRVSVLALMDVPDVGTRPGIIGTKEFTP
jgi:hypothetical protein